MPLLKFSSVSYFRNFIFGVEDSLVSTVGLLSGVAVAEASKEIILITGVILILVEAFSMAAGSFLSEYSAEGYTSQAEKPSKRDVNAGIIMFFSYFVAGFIPLAPYTFWSVDAALKVSVMLSVAALFLLGLVGAKISGTNIYKNGLRMVFVGGIAIAVGMAAGNILSGI